MRLDNFDKEINAEEHTPQFVVTNIKWSVDMDEVYETLDEMSNSNASDILRISTEKYANMTISERHEYAYDELRHNRVSIEDIFGLPDVIVVPNYIRQEDDISEWLSDEYGFCHEGFNIIYEK